MALGSPASVYTWGTGRTGELGHEQLSKDRICALPQPVQLSGQRPCLVSVAACEGCSASVASDGRLYAWGANYKLCSGAEDGSQPVPKPVAALGGVHIAQVSAGEYHVGCVSRDGRVFLWGKSEAGCCGDMDASTHKLLKPFELDLPTVMPGVAATAMLCTSGQQQPVSAALVECGYRTTLVLLHNGQVLTWGCGAGGRLGHGDSLDRHTPTLVRALASHHVVAASMGSCHSVVVTASGELLTWGLGATGCLGLGGTRPRDTPTLVAAPGMPPMASVSCTKGMVNPVEGPGQCGPHTLAVGRDGSLWGWGSGHKGKLGNLRAKWGFHLKGKEDSLVPYRVGGPAADDDKGPTGYLQGVHVVGAVASALHSAVWDDQGRLYTFGCGSDGRMGLKAYLKGSGQSRQRMKFYVSAPTVVESLQEQRLRVISAAASRRHMVAAAVAAEA